MHAPTSQTSRYFKPTILAILALALSAPWTSIATTWGCDVCIRMPQIPFEGDHLAAIEVAMATREAADRGDIDLNAPVTADLSASRYLSVRLSKITPQRMVQMWSRTGPAKKCDDLRFTIDIVFVDTEQTCHLDVRAGEVLIDVPRMGPADIRLFTTRAGFQSLFLHGLDSCEQQTLAKLESDDQQRRGEFAQLFTPSLDSLQAQASAKF